jgi:uncharacterized protein with FMN-binding domain
MERLAQRSRAAKEAALNRATGSDAPSPDPARPTQRKHAARSARYLSLALSLFATVVLTVAFSILSLPSIDQFALAAVPTPSVASTPKTVAAPIVSTFDGDVVRTRWGPVQVQAQFKNGVLEDVVTLVFPNDRGTSIFINQQALPMLRSEVLTAQSAHVDTISGASVTSRGYVASLQSAIDAAQAAGAVNL